MDKINVLDCTLRDGGYCNDWKFGWKNVRKIVRNLVDADIDIIECGFLTKKVIYDKEITKYTTMREIAEIIPENRKDKLFVCMINYGEYPLKDIPPYDGTSVDGLRVAFHKVDMLPALEYCKGLREKGYKVFLQAMVSQCYSDQEFLDLIQRTNKIQPYAFYIVDSFGIMKRPDLLRLFYLVDNNLQNGVAVGYHSHNNMQLSYSNAQALVDIHTRHNLIIDASVFGMGRGAGNLNTELFVEYLNEYMGKSYILKPLLTIIDDILNAFYQQNYWGYSLPNYLSAKHNCHPNYASYLDAKKTLTVQNMDEIFSMMEDRKRASYDKAYIEELYIQYMTDGCKQGRNLERLSIPLQGKDVLVIAPGYSSISEKEKVIACAQQKNMVSISVNFDYGEWETDFIFISNLRRFHELDKREVGRCIVTSNIPCIDCFATANYSELLNPVDFVKDNAGLMLIQLLINLGVKKIFLAGLDGYSPDESQNYANSNMSFYAKRSVYEAMNRGMSQVLGEYKRQIDIRFITATHLGYDNSLVTE